MLFEPVALRSPVLRTTLLLLGIAVGAWAQSPCEGRIKDKRDHPMDPTFPKPAPGESYIDPVFGTRITRITNPDPAEGKRAIIKTLYSTMRGWNADQSLILLWHRSPKSRYELYEGDAPYRHLRSITFGDSHTFPSDIEEVLWDPVEPLVFYYPSGYSLSSRPDPRIYKRTLAMPDGPDRLELLRIFDGSPTNCPPALRVRLGKDPHDMAISGEQKIIGLVCGSTRTKVARTQFLYSIAENRVLAVAHRTDKTAPWPLPSGNGAYWQDGTITDLSFKIVARITMPDYHEHAALARGPSYDTYNHVQFSGANAGTLVSHRLDRSNSGKVIIGRTNGWPYPPGGTHISAGAANGSGWVAVGIIGPKSQRVSEVGHGVLNNEVVLANVLTGEVCRVAHLRTLAKKGPWGYWAESHVQISNDGYRILFTSDWMGSSTVDTYVIDLRPGASSLPGPRRGSTRLTQ